jgi:putative ABC transport system permease protein
VRGDTIRGDLFEEFQARAAGQAPRRATVWYWRQALALAARYRLTQGRREDTAERWGARAHDASSGVQGAPPRRAMYALTQDLRFAARTLRKAPGFTAAALATLALGIGASTAIFSIVNAVLIRPLPYLDPDRLIVAQEIHPLGRPMSVAWPNYLDWRARFRAVEDLACYRSVTFTLTGLDHAERLDGRQVSWTFVRVLGVQPALGRAFTEADDRPGAEHVVMVSHGFWQRRLGGNPRVLGRRLTLDAEPHTIVGVLPPDFWFVREDDVYEPFGVTVTQASGSLDRGNHPGLVALGRLRPGVEVGSARAELESLAAALAREHPDTNSGNGARVQTLASRIVGDLRPALIALMAAVGCLLLVACVNIANLLVARGAARRPELAVRAALGGSRLQLVRQLVVESTLVSLVGGGLGVVVGAALLQLLLALAPANLPRLDEVQLDAATLLFAFGAAAACGLLFGVYPAVHASSVRGQEALVRAGRTASTLPTRRLRRTLMVVEVALALMLLAGAGLMARTLRQLTAVDAGFDPGQVLTLRFSLEGDAWTRERCRVFYEESLARIRALPGVVDAALTLSLPIAGSEWNSVFIVGDQPVPARAELPSAAFTPVSPRFFETLRIRLVAGRLLDPTDRSDTPHVAVVNETLARRLWPRESPIGKRLKQGWPEWGTPWREIVGVVRDVKLEGVAEETPLQAYVPLAQDPAGALALVVRAATDAAPLVSRIEDILRGFDPDLPVYDVQTMRQRMAVALARERVSTVILGVFAFVAVALASVGLYGVVSQSVTERTHEIGVRMALGAGRRHVVRQVVAQGFLTVVAGAAIGVTGALGVSRFLAGLLFGVTPTDPLTFGAVILVLLAVSLVACVLPALRAARVDPALALRAE